MNTAPQLEATPQSGEPFAYPFANGHSGEEGVGVFRQNQEAVDGAAQLMGKMVKVFVGEWIVGLISCLRHASLPPVELSFALRRLNLGWSSLATSAILSRMSGS